MPKKTDPNQSKLFSGKDGQLNLFNGTAEQMDREEQELKTAPVECMGHTYRGDAARREHFLKLLEAKLKDPEFRKTPGFPEGTDEDILRMSDPPYYTACPNPFLGDFVKYYGTSHHSSRNYTCEPFAADVSEGKNDRLYNMHSYHTKVPHKAIMRYILHYTQPGDVILDAFCGTGMTGIAARLCGDEAEVRSLGYAVDREGLIRQADAANNSAPPISKLGGRHAVLNDLSPAATFIVAGYCNLVGVDRFVSEAIEVVERVEAELNWLYLGADGNRVLGAVWSDVFSCPECSREIVFWTEAVKNDQVLESFPCPNCGTVVGKAASRSTGAQKLERPTATVFDPVLATTVTIPKLVMVQETVKASRGRVSRPVSEAQSQDFFKRFEGRDWPPVPVTCFAPGRQTNKLINGSGISHVCHMYTQRALFAFAKLWSQQLSSPRHTQLFRYCLSAINNYVSRKQGYFGGGGGVSGTLFTPSIHLEKNVFDVLRRKLEKLVNVCSVETSKVAVTTQSVARLDVLPDASIDYVFTDPPFGESLQYSELNSFIEAWLRVHTSAADDCVLNYVHKKDLLFYTNLMRLAFSEYARVLKPGRWVTIEFHNSQNAVWSAIQHAIEASGLVVADVRVLNKQQRSFNAVNRAGAVDQDLVISAYRPNGSLEQTFRLHAGTEHGVWDFTRAHLAQLPVFVGKESSSEVIAERQGFLLFDRMVAFYVQRNATVPVTAAEFYGGLATRFGERDGMYFLPEQMAEYDRKRMSVREVLQLQLFVTDEVSAIQWIKQQLHRKPQTFQELQPQFMKEISGWERHERPIELTDILEQNYLKYDGSGEVPSQIHAYLSTNMKDSRKLTKADPILRAKAVDRWYVPDPKKATDLEKLREKSLLKEFETYNAPGGKKLKVFRLEAVRAGFKKAWEAKDYKMIIEVAKRIPEDVLQEDQKLVMWYDNALTRAGVD